MSDTITRDDIPTSFGSFKPTGHVMVGLPDRDSLNALRTALLAAGWLPEHLVDFTPRETVEEMSALIDNASPLAGFGSEITMMRRYVEEARRGTCWLLVKAEGNDTLQRLGDMARQHRTRLAVAYGLLVVEELV